MPRENPWTPDTITRFWDHFASQPLNTESYFSNQVGAGLAALLVPVKPPAMGARVLDYGCGQGFVANALLSRGYQVAGVDSSPESTATSNRRLAGVTGWLGALTSPGPPVAYDDATFDAVTCVETLEHLGDPFLQEILGDIHRLLKPDGVALFTTPNDERLEDSFLYCPFCDTEFHRMQHVRSFDRATLHRTLSESGFDVSFCRPIDIWLLVPGQRLLDVHAARAPRQAAKQLATTVPRLIRRARARGEARLFGGGLEPFLRDGSNLVAIASRHRDNEPGHAAPAT